MKPVLCCPKPSFSRVLHEKCEVDCETEYSLPEYMPNVARIIKTDVNVRVREKTWGEKEIAVEGDLVFCVLYLSDYKNKLRSAVFSESFRRAFAVPETDEVSGEQRLIVEVFPEGAISKTVGQRRIASRARISLVCDGYSLCEDTTDDTSCKKNDELEFLMTSADIMHLKISEDNMQDIREEVPLDEGMPEIGEIILADCHVCIVDTHVSDGSVSVNGEATFSCLYETMDAEGAEGASYVSFKKTAEFHSEYRFDGLDSSRSVLCSARVTGVGAESVQNNLGEYRAVSFSSTVNLIFYAMKNEEQALPLDAYAIGRSARIEKHKCRFTTFVGLYNEPLRTEEKLHSELHGITSVISCRLDTLFRAPEWIDDRPILPIRGSLSLLGETASGGVEAAQIPLNIRLPLPGLREKLNGDYQDLRVFGGSSLCGQECMVSGGELILKLWINTSLALMSEKTADVVASYEKEQEAEACEHKNGFTLYYPESGERVWDVAKAHHVSCERLKKENGVTGETFPEGKTVILR